MNLQKMIALFMDYCASKQLRLRTLQSYEQTLQLFARWLRDEMEIEDVEDEKETHIRSYIVDLQKRGKYTFCVDDKRCLMSGMDIYTLSKILGHSSVQVTEKAYLDVTDSDIRKRYSRFSPIDSIYYQNK